MEPTTGAERVGRIEGKIDTMEKSVAEISHKVDSILQFIQGNLEGSTPGIIGRLDRLERRTAVLESDAVEYKGTQNAPGIIVRIDRLEQDAKARSRWSVAFMGAGVSAFVAAVAALLLKG